jgi:hypothetical protein
LIIASTSAASAAGSASSRPCLFGRAEEVGLALAARVFDVALDAARIEKIPVRHVELAVQDRVPRGILVHVGRAMPDPLPRHEDRQLHMELDLAHLERRGMAMAQQVVDKALVLAHLLGALAVGDARRLHDRGVVAHVVDDAHEAVVEHRDGLVENLLQRWHGGAARRLSRVGEGVDLGLLFGGKRHRKFPTVPNRRW